jgi:PEP-CTERM motif
MLVLARVSVFSRITTAAAVWLCAAGAAWAGSGGGADLGGPQSALNDACDMFGISQTFCPQLPTVNQLIVENAALSSTTPAAVRQNQNLSSENAVDAGSKSGLANPLAFISPSNQQGQPIPIAPTNPAHSATNSFLTATTTPTNGHPTTLDLTFDYRLRTLGFTSGQEGASVGQIRLPLIKGDAGQNVDSKDLSNPKLATLEIKADPNTCPTCVTTDIIAASLTGDSNRYPLSLFGLTFSNDNSNPGSMNFSPNEKFTVGVPLLVPAAFLNTGLPGSPAYKFSASGHEFASGLFDGIDPVANFLDASFLNDNNNNPFAAVADLAIVTNGTTIIADPVPTPEASTLALLGSGLFGMALLRRRLRPRPNDPDAQRTAGGS